MGSMNKNKMVILTGAGAVIPWGSPTTNDITEKLKQDTTFRAVNGEPAGKYLYEKLTSFYNRDHESVNFETIINYIEILFSFFSSKISAGYSEFKTAMPLFFNIKKDIEEQILDLDNIYQLRNGSFIINDDIKNPIIISRSENQNKEFFSLLFNHFIRIIVDKIDGYCKNPINEEFRKFIAYFNKRKIIRFYTLNYDRIPAIASGIDFFEGFDKKEPWSSYTVDIKRIVNDDYINCYYNLHGSIHFKYGNNIELEFTPVKILSKLFQ